ncbi:MAG TPA: hypothetical protein VGP94_14940 [Tepidisphaeraceae bacterium]|nr:hypothetical protein [Tepidisphaeraceae bacterium]
MISLGADHQSDRPGAIRAAIWNYTTFRFLVFVGLTIAAARRFRNFSTSAPILPPVATSA